MLLTALSFLFGFVCVVLAIVPAVFIFHNVYEDGLFGRIGLSGVSFVSVLLLSVWLDFDGWPDFPFYDVVPLLCLMMAAFALFLCWHLIRFHLKVVMKGECVSCLQWMKGLVRR